jgi:heptosyltransferase-2
MWIGDFVRCHSVVKVLQRRWPDRPVDLLTTTLCAPLLDYMPGVRKGIVEDLPRGRLPLRQYRSLADRLRAENYGSVLVMPRTWKAALAPYLAGIPQRTGFFGEGRFVVLNDIRWGEYRLERMIDRCGVLALDKGNAPPPEWPLPDLVVADEELGQWLTKRGLAGATRPVIAMAPGAVGPGKAWPPEHYAELAKTLAEDGGSVWILGGPNERAIAKSIVERSRGGAGVVVDLTGDDLRNAILALKAADAAVTNDSGLMHIAAALGTPTVALFGPTSPRLWAPLNPLAAIIEPPGQRPDESRIKQRRTGDIAPASVIEAVRSVLAGKRVS